MIALRVVCAVAAWLLALYFGRCALGLAVGGLATGPLALALLPLALLSAAAAAFLARAGWKFLTAGPDDPEGDA